MRIFFAIFFVFLAGAGTASAGGCTSTCGGNWSAAEFYNIANDALEALGELQNEEKLDLGNLPYVKENGTTARLAVSFRDKHAAAITDREITANVNDLSDAFRLVSLSSDQLLIEGRPVDFRSAPNSGVVEFTEESWNKQRSARERLQLVIHELLMLAKRKHPEVYDDYNYRYQLSRRLADRALARMEQRERGVSGDADPNPCPPLAGREEQALASWAGAVDEALLAARAKHDAAQAARPPAAPEKLYCRLVYDGEAWLLRATALYVAEGSERASLLSSLADRCTKDHPSDEMRCRTTPTACEPVAADGGEYMCEVYPLFGRDRAVGRGPSRFIALTRSVEACFQKGFLQAQCADVALNKASTLNRVSCSRLK